jgi:hypothetical protein
MNGTTRATTTALGLALALAACGEGNAPAATDAGSAPVDHAAATAGGSAPSTGVAAAQTGTQASQGPLAGRDRELVNPDDSVMVLLYFDLAGITPPLDNWVERDSRVEFAQGTDKAAMRATLRQELEAGAAAVRGVGQLRLSLNNAGLSRYDPAYGEFRVGALSPSSVIAYSAFGQKVELKFGNGRTAQLWRVPQAEAQAITDRIGYVAVELDVLLRITGVQPGMGGGTLMVDVVEYELRESRGGTTLGRVAVGS